MSMSPLLDHIFSLPLFFVGFNAFMIKYPLHFEQF